MSSPDWTKEEQRQWDVLRRIIQIEESREKLESWCITAGYIPARHHKLIISALEELERGECDRLLITMPPGSAKSTYASILFPPWYMARNPTHNVLTASHTMNLAKRFGKRTRNLVQHNEKNLGISLRTDSKASDQWQLDLEEEEVLDAESNWTEGGTYLASGVDMGIAGFRADLAVIDDPIKNRKDAQSETVKSGIWEWWVYDVRPRLKPGGKVVLIMTRWAEDDLAGMCLEEEPGRWRVLRLPMICDSEDDLLDRRIGERLWPEWFTNQMVEEAKRDPYLWLSLYQQTPTAPEGTYWKKQWLHPVPSGHTPLRERLYIYGGSDYATKEGGGDYTVHIVIGLDTDDRPWLLDIWREQATSERWIEAFCDLVLKWKPIAWGEEQGQILKSVGPFLDRRQLVRRAYTNRQQFTAVADKPTMGRAIQAHIATQGLWYDENAHFRPVLEQELLAFPGGKHDDIHDALSKVGLLLSTAVAAPEPRKPKPSELSGYRSMKTGGGPPSLKVM